jgi:hypothetical protein
MGDDDFDGGQGRQKKQNKQGGGGGGKGGSGIHYVAQLPKFLQKFQEKQSNVREKRESPEMEDRDDNAEEQPIVYVADDTLKKEYDAQVKQQEELRKTMDEARKIFEAEREKKQIADASKFGVSAENAIVFRGSSSKETSTSTGSSGSTAPVSASTKKRKADDAPAVEGSEDRRKRAPTVKNKKLLSFGDEEEDS